MSETPNYINLRDLHGDHTVSLFLSSRPGKPPRWTVTMTPDNPLTYGYEEASMRIGADQIARLRDWLDATTVAALERGETKGAGE